MSRIKITDLPRDLKISKAEMKKVMGGGVEPSPFRSRLMNPGDDKVNNPILTNPFDKKMYTIPGP